MYQCIVLPGAMYAYMYGFIIYLNDWHHRNPIDSCYKNKSFLLSSRYRFWLFYVCIYSKPLFGPLWKACGRKSKTGCWRHTAGDTHIKISISPKDHNLEGIIPSALLLTGQCIGEFCLVISQNGFQIINLHKRTANRSLPGILLPIEFPYWHLSYRKWVNWYKVVIMISNYRETGEGDFVIDSVINTNTFLQQKRYCNANVLTWSKWNSERINSRKKNFI